MNYRTPLITGSCGAAALPFDDFDTDDVGTLDLLKATRRSSTKSPFVT